MPVLHPKFLHCFGICTHPCNLGTHTGGLTPFHPPLDTTTLAIVVDGVQAPDCLLLEPGYESSRQGSSSAGIGELDTNNNTSNKAWIQKLSRFPQ